MSGIEVVGTIASVISIIDGATKVWDRARKDLNISKTFETVATRLPILQDTLRTCNNLLEPRKDTLPKNAADALLKTLKSCETKAEKLHKIFQETVPGESEEWFNRYHKVASRLGKGSKVEELMKSIAEDAQIVANYHLVKAARSDLSDELDTIIKQMDKLEPSLPDDDNLGNVFNAYGGTMNNNLNYGSGPQNTGSGDMYNISGLSGNPVFRLGPSVVTTSKFTGLYSHSASRTVQKYVARPELQNKLQAQLIGHKDSSKDQRTVVIWGLGGSGKSQLTLNYMQKHRQAYDPIFWIDARVKETIERDFTQIHKLLYPDLDTSSATVEHAIAAVKNWLSTEERQKDRRRALWIIDSADTIDDGEGLTSHIDLQHYLPDASNLDIIITTRSSRARFMSSHDSVEVEKMAETEARLLFLKNANLPLDSEETEQEVLEIVQELGYLALAVALAGSYVSETKIEVRQYLPRYRADRTRILALKPHKLEHQYTESVLSTWELSFAALQRQSPVAAQLLTLLAFLNPNDIFIGLFEEALLELDESNPHRWLKLLSPGDAHIDIALIESAFAAIQAYSLISWQQDQKAYIMHNMVHAWGHERLEVSLRQYWSFATLELLNLVTDRNIRNFSIATRMVPHMVATFTVIKNVCGSDYQTTNRDTTLLPKLRYNSAVMGHYALTYDVDVCLLQTTKLVHGLKHPKTLKAMRALGGTTTVCGDYVQAEKLFRETLELQEEILGYKHRDTLDTKTVLGANLHNQGKYGLAEEVAQSTLELQQRELNSDDPDTLNTMCLLAGIFSAQGKHRQAEEMQRRVLESRKQLHGLEHGETLGTMSFLADTLYRLGKYEEAEQVCQQLLELQQKVLGPGHPQTLSSRSLFAFLLGRKGDYGQAKVILQETIALQQQIRGLEHNDVLLSLDRLASVLKWQGEYEEAEHMWQGLIETATRTRGSEHPETQILLESLAALREEMSKKPKADLSDITPQQELIDAQSLSQEDQSLVQSRTTRTWKRILTLRDKRRTPHKTPNPTNAATTSRSTRSVIHSSSNTR